MLYASVAGREKYTCAEIDELAGDFFTTGGRIQNIVKAIVDIRVTLFQLKKNNDPLSGQRQAFPFQPAELGHRMERLKQSSVFTGTPASGFLTGR